MRHTDIFQVELSRAPHLVVREQARGRGRPKHTLFRLDGKTASRDGKCPSDLAKAISARMRLSKLQR